MDEENSNSGSKGTLKWIPLGVGGFVLIIYLITLTPWLLHRNVQDAAMAGGWSWNSSENFFVPPLLYLLSIPSRLVGGDLGVTYLNFLSLVCGTVSALFLALTIQCFPQNRTRDQRIREKSSNGTFSGSFSWVPIIVGTLIFSFQLTIWERSTAFTVEIINTALFSVIVWGIIRSRIDQSNQRLSLVALLIGISLANDGGTIGFLPFYIAGIVWVKKKDILSYHFAVGSIIAFVAGLSLYLLVPIIHPYNGIDGVSYFERLVSYLGTQKSYLLLRPFRLPAIIFGLTSIVPVVFALVRWPGQLGDMSAVGAFFSQIMFRIFHVVFLVACLYICFDQAHSPRQSEFGSNLLYMRYQFLTGLAVAYYLGYFLILLSKSPESRRRKKPVLPIGTSRIIAWGLSIIFLLAPIALLAKNYPFIQAQKSTPWKAYAESMAQSILADNSENIFVGGNNVNPGASYNLMFLRAVLPSEKAKKIIFFDASVNYLDNPTYHKFLKKAYQEKYPELPESLETQKKYTNTQIVAIFKDLVESAKGYYLNQSFGFFFEVVYSDPAGFAYSLTPYSKDNLNYPLISQSRVSEFQQFSKDIDEKFITPLKAFADLNPPSYTSKSGFKSLSEPEQLNFLMTSKMNDIGYRLMRSGHLDLAKTYFDMCVKHHVDNLSAEINSFALKVISSNTGKIPSSEWQFPEDMKEELNKKLQKFPSLEALLNYYGFFDNPDLNIQLARVFFENGLPRQGYQFVKRSLELNPGNYNYYADGAVYIINQGRPDIARTILDQLKQNIKPEDLPFEDQNLAIKIESRILTSEGKLDEGVKLMEQSAQDEPDRESTLRFLASLYESVGKPNEVIAVCSRQLTRFPQDEKTLLKLALAYARNKEFEKAIETNNKALSINENFWQAVRNNAFVYGQMQNWPKVIESLQQLLKLQPRYSQGLLEISSAYENLGDNENAIKYLEEYGLLQPEGSEIAIQIEERIEALKKD